MKFYEIDVFHTATSKYTWASGYGPIAENISEIPFLKDAPEVFLKNRTASWRVNKSKPGIEFDSVGKEWPDVLGCGQGNPFIFISQKIINDLRDFKVPYLRATEMPLAPPLPKRLLNIPPPSYFVLEGIPGLEVSWTAMGIARDHNNRIDYSTGRPKPWPPAEWKVSQSSWTGLDLMSYKNWQLPMTLICTDEIRDLAKAREWTNILFRPLVTVE